MTLTFVFVIFYWLSLGCLAPKMMWYFEIILSIVCGCTAQRYPITAAWFNDHVSRESWNETLSNFTRNGGDTVLLRPKQFLLRSQQDMEADPDFASCSATVTDVGPTCFEDAKNDMDQLGLTVASFASYKSNENFSDTLIHCPSFEKKLVRARTYIRLVLPTKITPDSKLCDYPKGTPVVLLFTSYDGVDSNELVVRAAAERNMSVYLGFPNIPSTSGPYHDCFLAYLDWLSRLIVDQRERYSSMSFNHSIFTTGYGAVAGYSTGEAKPLANFTNDKDILNLYSSQSATVHFYGKKVLVSASLDLRKSGGFSIDGHVKGLNALVNASSADVMNVQEGRGYGKACYYWPTQNALPISQVDKSLDAVLHYQNPQLKPNITFDDFFTGSVQQVMAELFTARDTLQRNNNSFDMWLNIEPFEFLRENPCLPTFGPGISISMDRATKARLDMALSAGAVYVQKVAVSDWDPYFTCIPKNTSSTLAQQVYHDAGRPIITHCSFHNQYNRSVVVIGFNLLGLTQGFNVTWPDTGHTRHTSYVHGYYFESAYGSEHHLVPSLIYTQLYDPYNVMQLNPKGTVRVKAGGANRACIFTYDYTYI
ncbi:uncharacterized protein [Argopecten irradians]|uniref:uncharacterized protein n=1 Tax=Argopecten irradians TaxID=31199 RepID=UPI00371A3160